MTPRSAVKLFASTLGSHNRVSAFLGALRSFTQFALLSRRIHRGCAGIEYPRPVANQLGETYQDFGNISALFQPASHGAGPERVAIRLAPCGFNCFQNRRSTNL